MTSHDFISKYDHPGSIVLLLGKRSVLEADMVKLLRMGELLAAKTKHMVFRSGNAEGADNYFSLGVSCVDYKRLEVIIPFNGHRKTMNKAYSVISLDNIDLLEEPEVLYQSKTNQKTSKLIDSYALGNRDSYSMKASFIIRDTIMVIGSNSGIPPATVGLFYDDLDQLMTGGTGHTMRICQANNIPFFNQSVWFNWL